MSTDLHHHAHYQAQSHHYQTIRVNWQETICTLQLHRPEAKNTINDQLIAECKEVVAHCQERATILILEGLDDVFCFGADFAGMAAATQQTAQSPTTNAHSGNPEPLYNLWLQLATGNFISVAHVRGQANAGGIGFVAACDLVVADNNAVFSLSELLFGLMPACVLPFLIRKIGYQKAHAMTLMTQPVDINQAGDWGLVDSAADNSKLALNKHLLRLRRLNKTAIGRYKHYINSLDTGLQDHRDKALAANLEVFNDTENIANISRYVDTGKFPWEGD